MTQIGEIALWVALVLSAWGAGAAFIGGRSLDFRQTNGRVEFSAPYQPEMNWSDMTLSCWLKVMSSGPQEVVSYSSSTGTGKFRLWFDGAAWVFDVAEGDTWRSARWTQRASSRNQRWRHFAAIVDAKARRIRLYVEGELKAEAEWNGPRLKAASAAHRLVIGASGDPAKRSGQPTWFRPFEGQIDEVMLFDSVVDPNRIRSMGVLR